MDTHVTPPPMPGQHSEATPTNFQIPTAAAGTAAANDRDAAVSVFAPDTDPAVLVSFPPVEPTPCIVDPGHVHKSASEDDVLIYGRPVHVHGSLAEQHSIHRPQHHNPHGPINYAKAAHNEMDDMVKHPPHTTIIPGAKTGVEAWDKVQEELPSRSHHHQSSSG